jgi:hypothetical protein
MKIKILNETLVKKLLVRRERRPREYNKTEVVFTGSDKDKLLEGKPQNSVELNK